MQSYQGLQPLLQICCSKFINITTNWTDLIKSQLYCVCCFKTEKKFINNFLEQQNRVWSNSLLLSQILFLLRKKAKLTKMGSNPVISRVVWFCLLDNNWKKLEKKWKNLEKIDISLLSQGLYFYKYFGDFCRKWTEKHQENKLYPPGTIRLFTFYNPDMKSL